MGIPVYQVNGIYHSDCSRCKTSTPTSETKWFGKESLCPSCHQKAVEPLIEAFQEDYELGKCDYDSDLICPYCGHENDSTDAFDGGEPTEWDCQRCGLNFDVEVEYSVTYSTKRKQEANT